MWWDEPAWHRMPMGGPDYDRYWDEFYARFRFKPSTTVFPGIAEPRPSVTFDLSPIFASPPADWVPRQDRLTAEVLEALRETFAAERLVVLNWQHDALWLVPRDFSPQSDDDWAIPVFPNGDYYIFLSESMDDGFFGHPWEHVLRLRGASSAVSCSEVDALATREAPRRGRADELGEHQIEGSSNCARARAQAGSGASSSSSPA